ncbi:T9SS type A sorting domain-containing protein [Seonamhaeicola sp. MEBiC1930]|uniref:T9SS type A sorting domain-containing protein n=1 Tax=Seonamhaeicola sp. MEBiC01930 TaxID=2976768 RepID=UPI00325090A2
MKKITSIILLLIAFNLGYGQSIFDNPITGTNPGQISPYITGQTVNDYITVSGIIRGPGLIGRNAVNRYSAGRWDEPSLDTSDYFEFVLTPYPGFEIDFVSFVYTGQASTTGPVNFSFRSSLDGYLTDIGTPTVLGTTIDLSAAAYQDVTGSITFRFYGWGASSASGTFSINDFTFNGVVSSPSCALITKWDGTTWDNGNPDLTAVAVIDGAYTTDVTDGSFSACSLIINSGGSLTVDDGYYVVVENDLVVDGTISIQPEGAFIQNNDSGTVTNNGTIEVDKLTAPLNNWYEYTFWSSPVSDATVEDALSDSDWDRRFTFNGALFNDEVAETANNNTFLPGQDDVDDNGDAWQWVSGSTKMEPGVGYAATHSEIAYVIPGANYRYTFKGGVFNNGVITVPVNRNDNTTADSNWNFIGNPYPSAIEIDAFMVENRYDASTNPGGVLDGSIYFWSQNTDYLSTANGAAALNFDTTDYAVHNGVGGTQGGDSLTPNGFIPSGQGFFFSFSDDHVGSSGTVEFNNSMRSIGLSPDNSQFFKNSVTKKGSGDANKLWVNLTSDNGVFNQILIGYVDGASDSYDGAYYDAKKIVTPTTYAALFTIIDGFEKKFIIQGKDPNSLDENETISLGFKTNIDVATLYNMSLANVQGDFLTTKPIYIKDNLLNKIHDLAAGDYTFTSEVGEFNDRFVIAYSENALSTYNVLENDNTLRIIELENDNVRFVTTNNLKIKSINVYDILGRAVYNFKTDSNSETFTLSKLNNSVFIAKVELSNGLMISRKVVKK